MAQSTEVKKIIWALDAFDQSGQLQQSAAHAIKQIYSKTNSVIEPVYVMSPAELNVSVEFTMPWIMHYLPAAEKALSKLMEAMFIPNALPPHVLVQNHASTSDAVKTLAGYALKSGADLIVVSTHGRSGVGRLLMAALPNACSCSRGFQS